MGWFKDIPAIFQIGLLLIALIGLAIFFLRFDWDSPDKTENMEKLTGKLVEESIPTELTWIQKVSNKFQNHPYILLSSVVGILWLFGYFNKK